jgi:hypothetical protein
MRSAYGSTSPIGMGRPHHGTVFGQRANLARPAFKGMLRNILRFNRAVVSDPAGGSTLSLNYRGKIQSVITKRMSGSIASMPPCP